MLLQKAGFCQYGIGTKRLALDIYDACLMYVMCSVYIIFLNKLVV